MKPKTFKYSDHLLRAFLGYFKPHLGLFIMDLVCAMVVAGIDLAYPLISRNCMYELLPNNRYRAFFVVLAVIVFAYIVRSILQYIIAYWGHTFGIRVEADIRSDLYAHIQSLGFEYFDKNRTGQLMSRLTSDLFDVTELAHHGPEDLIICGVTLVGSLGVMFAIQWKLALIVAIILPIFAVTVMSQRKAMQTTSASVKENISVINAQIESGLSGIRTSKAFANEEIENEKFERSNAQFRTAKKQFHKAMGRFSATMEFFLCMLSVAVIGFGGFQIMQGKMDYIDLITFSLYITAFTNPMRKIANFSELFASGFAGLRRFASIIDEEPSIKDSEDAVTLNHVSGSIEIDHVRFSYNNHDEVLRDVSVMIRPGETVAVVGPSGGGKTTLCQLIPRFYDVVSGTVSVDGIDVRKIKQSSLHEQIGIVQQDVFLFADSIMENIRYGMPTATDDEVIEAAKKAEIYEDILAMPKGFDTYVGERGVLLSGGQKQRISIARIFLKNPPILILDEATSALDSVTEARIQSAFDALAKGRTTLIIAHRLSTIRGANRILVISSGVISESGTHDELLALNGHYAELYHTQNSLGN